jgi:general L-amino acid transport system substrate-binding protein
MNRKQKLIAAAALAAVAATWAIPAQAGRTLNAVKSRGMVVCGVNTAAPGFSGADSRGHWKGLDVDICRAVAAAVLKDANKVKFVPLSSEQRFTALQSGQIDILARNTTWSMSRDASQGSVFVAMDYLDGQGFMVPKKYKIHSAKQLNGATICVQTGTSSEKNLADFARANNIKYKPVVFSTTEATQGAFISGRCQAYTTDRSDLAGARLRAKNPNDYVILPETISKEPLGMAIRRGDDDWFQIVRWSFYTMVEAEELGITQKNADSLRSSKNQVGNYGESFEANLGPKTPLGLSRGLNRLWTKGGILISPPIR